MAGVMAIDPLTIARRLTARGLVVIPVHRPGLLSDGKTPSVAWKRFQAQHPTIDDLAHWFTGPPMNLAIVTGTISGVVVIDVDAAEGFEWARDHLPITPWMVKTSKGWHFYYQHPGELVPNRVRLPVDTGTLPIDVRGDGGFVIGPGSLHASGVWYRCAGDWTYPRSALPVFDVAWLPAPRPPVRVTNDEGRRRHLATGRPHESPSKVIARARAYLAVIPPPVIGDGSDRATFIAACHLVRGFALTDADALELLWEWAGHRPGWDRDWLALKVKSATSSHRTEPIGAML
jgi:hypothetical protein